MIRVSLDDNIAAAITNIASNKSDWELLMHYIALNIVRGRDQLEKDLPEKQKDRLAGYVTGLRFLFELQPRAEALIAGEKFDRDAQIVGEEGFIVEPLSDD
jgi:hypothetical protein